MQNPRLEAGRGGWSPRQLRLAAMHLALAGLVPLAVFANKGVVLAFLLAALPNLRRSGAAAMWRSGRLVVLGVGLLCAWALASLAFAPEPDPQRALRHLVLLPLGVVWIGSVAVLPATQARGLVRTLTVVVCAMLLLFVFERASGGLLTRLAHPEGFTQPIKLWERIGVGVVLLAGLAWPVLGWLWPRRRGASVLLAAAVCACIASLPTTAALLGMGAGALAFLLSLRWPRVVLSAMLAGFVGYAAVAPAVSSSWLTIAKARDAGLALPVAWEHRLAIWHYVADEIAVAGALGAGYDASRVLGRRGDLVAEIVGEDGTQPQSLPLHPHNAVLQVWLELGLPGIVALVLICAGICAAIWRARVGPSSRAAMSAALATMLVPFLLSFGVWQAWWLSALLLVAGSATALAVADDAR